MPSLNCIIAVDNNNGISKNGVIPWKIKEDMQLFTKLTSHTYNNDFKNVVIMGKNTWLSIDERFRPLKNRINVIISTSMTNDDIKNLHNVFIFNSLNKAIDYFYLMDKIENIYVMGGTNIYNEFFKNHIADNLYLTIVYKKYNCDNIINTININNYYRVHSYSRKLQDHTSNEMITTSFIHYINKNKGNEYDNCMWDKQFGKILKNILNSETLENKEEKQYLQIMSDIIKDGHYRPTRNANTYSIFGTTMKFNLESFPLLTTKKMFLRGIFEELKFFLLGQTDTKILEAKNVNIWKGNTSSEFLKLSNLPYDEGDMGPMYGFQLRHFNADYNDCKTDYNNKGFDQLKFVIETLRTDRFNRRIMMTTYNPAQVHLGVLAPCHGITIQFGISGNNKLCCNMYQRSADWFLGVPFNIASYALLVYIICNIVNTELSLEQKEKYGILEAGVLTMSFGDAHVYESHLEVLKEQLLRKPYKFPILKINKSIESLDELYDLEFKDLELIDYECHTALKANMIA